jgi:hypothetical protein
VCIQVDASKADDEEAVALAIDQSDDKDAAAAISEVLPKDDKDAAAAIDHGVPVPSVLAESVIDNTAVSKGSPSKRQKLQIHSDDSALELMKPKLYRSMYYKTGLCLKSCAYIFL